MSRIFSKNVDKIEISGIRKFFNKVAYYPNAVSLTLGQPDFKVPQKIKDAMIKAINGDKTTYTSNAGIVELRSEISRYLAKFHIEFSPDEICITIGGSEAILSTFTALLNEDDNILIPSPAYPAYESCAKILGSNVINYPLKEDFSIDFDKLFKLILKYHPKAMVLSYPCNPTGAVLSKSDRDKLYDIIKKNEMIVISDEIYSALCFEDDYYSIAQYSDIKDKVVLISGFSKMFSMTGLRIGYVCAVSDVMKSIMKVHQYNVSCAPSISQWGAYDGLRYCLDDVEIMKNEFMKRRDYLYKRLTDLGFDTVLPKGAFYMFPSIKNFNMKSEEFCERMLKEADVAAVPGSAFGKLGEGHIRISYSYGIEELEEAVKRMENWIKCL